LLNAGGTVFSGGFLHIVNGSELKLKTDQNQFETITVRATTPGGAFADISFPVRICGSETVSTTIDAPYEFLLGYSPSPASAVEVLKPIFASSDVNCPVS
jgi:hypothetical protein